MQCCFKGKVIGTHPHPTFHYVTLLLTEFGTTVFVCFDDEGSWFPFMKIGDEVECDEGWGWFESGQLVSNPRKEMTVNGIKYEELLMI
jgi:hypothetical protein